MSSYLGRGLEQVDNISKLDNLSFNGGTTYALTKDSSAFQPISSNAILISISGVIQQGNFTVSGTNIVFNTAVASSESCDFIMHYGTGLITTPADDTVSSSKIQNNAITSAKILNDAVTKDKIDLITDSNGASVEAKGSSGYQGAVRYNCENNSHYTELKSAPHGSYSGNLSFTLPSSTGTNGQVLQTNGSGLLSFVDAPGGGSMEFISSASVTSTVSNTGFSGSTFSSTYENYYFILHNILNGIDDQSVYMRFRDTSGNVLSASEYDWVHVGGNTSPNQVNNSSANDTAIHLLKNKDLDGTGGNSNANKGYVEGIIFSPYKLSYASNDNQHCSVVWRATFPRSTYLHTLHGSATFTNGTQLGGFQIYGGGGGGPTYTDRFEGAVYGIKRS